MVDDARDGLLLMGIDGSTPLGFLAALGLLKVLDEGHLGGNEPRSRLSWRQVDAWRPVLHGVTSLDSIVDAVARDAQGWSRSPVLGFQYVKVEKKGPKTVGGLKAPLAVVRAWQRERREEGNEQALADAAALFCEGVTDTLKKSACEEHYQAANVPFDSEAPLDEAVERTFFDFTARNAQFLEQVEAIRTYLTPELIRTGLEEGYPDIAAAHDTRTLDWDPSSDTPGAIYTGYRRGLLPVHEWLAFRGLSLFPLTAIGRRVRMTGCTGRRLRGEFTWPLWLSPAPSSAVSSLVGYPRLAQLSSEQRQALGISLLLSAELTKKADGYTGTFAPAGPV